MTVFYVIRHGRTLFNEKDRVQGWCDSPLTQTAVNQTRSLADGLKDIPFDSIHTSPSGRARTTACILAEGRNTPVQTQEWLREINYGILEGEHIQQAFPEGHMDPVGYAKFSGEDICHAQQRIIHGLQDLSAENPDGTVALVSHGHIIKLLLSTVAREYGPEEVDVASRIPNCSVTKLELKDNRLTLLEKPDISWRI